ncbi:sulfite exporter TauE/SafE family protein [Salinibacterium sp. TMP30]|uniref:sulfite exporter TauE/SafE family protein n=1 Tax=Salinibacterium sp. TMP30 TaxID=3138237 RepID=UPI003138BEFC
MIPWDVVVLAGAGLLAGMVNAMAGGGTLISFPILLGLGMPAVVANVTSAVGLSSGYLGAAIEYRRELNGQGARMWALVPFALVGGLLGAIVLLLAPAAIFRAAAPYLVLSSCALMAAQPILSRLVKKRAVAREKERPTTTIPHTTISVRVGVLLAGIYGAYFGAGLGILLLAVLGILIDDSLQRLNGLKAALSLAVNFVSVTLFILSGHVSWVAAGTIFAAAAIGGIVGARVARVLSPAVLRTSVIIFGLVVAVVLLVRG